MNLETIVFYILAVLVAVGFVLWAAAKLVTAYAQKDPVVNEWDARAEKLRWASASYAQAVEWLVAAGAKQWTGAQKLAEVEARVKEFEALIDKGEYVKAIVGLSGFYRSALSKVEAAKKTALGELNGGVSTGEEAEETDPLANTPASEESSFDGTTKATFK